MGKTESMTARPRPRVRARAAIDFSYGNRQIRQPSSAEVCAEASGWRTCLTVLRGWQTSRSVRSQEPSQERTLSLCD